MLHCASARSNIPRVRSRISRYTVFVAGDEWGMRGDYMLAGFESLLMQPALDRHPHFGEMACEKMVAGDEYQLLGFGSLVNNLFQSLRRAECVMVTANEELGF